MIAAELYPTPKSIEGALGIEFAAKIADSIGELNRLTASDENFSALLAIGFRLSQALYRRKKMA